MCLSQSIISFTDGTLHTFFYMTAIITPLFNRILVKTVKTRNIRYQNEHFCAPVNLDTAIRISILDSPIDTQNPHKSLKVNASFRIIAMLIFRLIINRERMISRITFNRYFIIGHLRAMR